MKKPLLHRATIVLAATACLTLTLASMASAAEFVVPVDMKNVGATWTYGIVTCQVSGAGMQPKTGFANAPLVNGAFKGNVNVTVALAASDIPLAKSWYCSLAVGYPQGNSVIGPNGSAPAAPGTPFKDHDNGNY